MNAAVFRFFFYFGT
ncbi:pheST operon leader peptide PheM [Edaphovirga cremea]|nr:pheST operon leader peptide PheM [Edaphovirga cremea]